jgi:tetratricopeptide (TPR) repeat protein
MDKRTQSSFSSPRSIPRNALVTLEPDSTADLTFRANLYLTLDLLDTAMRDYMKANDLAAEKEGWILGNIGNLYNHRDFFSLGIDFLNKGAAIEPTSDYIHERLAQPSKVGPMNTQSLLLS